MNTAACKSCGARIIWVVSAASGKRMPVNEKPDLDGNLMIDAEGKAHVIDPKKPVATLTYTSHFATCPEAAQWKKKK